MQWNGSYVESVFSFANNINTQEGGSHLTGFRSALTATLNKYARDKGLLKEKEDNLEGEDVREGLAAVISVKLSEPAVRGTDEDEARQPVGRGPRQADREPATRRVPRGEPDGGAPDHQQGGRRPRARARPRARRASSPDARARSRATRCPGELADCQINDPESAELFLVEGHSAGGSAVDASRPQLPGDPAAARQGHQRREEPDQQGALERGDPGDRHGDRHGDRRGVRHLEAPLPPRDRHDGRRRRRRPHPHAHPHVPLPADAGARRARPRVHRRRRRSTA